MTYITDAYANRNYPTNKITNLLLKKVVAFKSIKDFDVRRG